MTQHIFDTDAIQRFSVGLSRIQAGLDLQHARIRDYNASVPVQHEGTDYEFKLHTDPEIDLDYYAIELGRLIALSNEISMKFGNPSEIDQARVAFLAAVPEVKIRNAIVHFDDRPRLDNVVFLGGAIRRLHPDGSVEHLIDARYQHHDAALAFAAEIGSWLRSHLCAAIAADPAAPIDQQIRSRPAAAPER